MGMEIERLKALAAALKDALEKYSPDEPQVEVLLAYLHLALQDADAMLMSASDFSLACGVLGEEVGGLREAVGICSAMLRQFTEEATGGRRVRTNLTWLQNAFGRVQNEMRSLSECIGPTPHPGGQAALRQRAGDILAQLSEYTSVR